ncbi:MAG: restriction endonuclease subunit S [Clostridia bacterium]|nr:restriction endonuclease subunit S [Clostridia bacterium]
MPKYRFEEIAINSTEKKKPAETDKDTYIGLEHLDSGSLEVTRWGAEVAPIGDKLVMHKGDVLFGRRRAYQKKVAIAPFDGIFSAHGMVLRPIESVITKYFFPFFISSDYFLDAAIKISVGSLSPTINWRDLAKLEFQIPSLDEQIALSSVLWAMNRLKMAYTALLKQADALVQSQFVEMFGDVITNSFNWPMRSLATIAETRLGKMVDAKKQTGEYRHPYIANFNVQWFHFDFSELREMDFLPEDQLEFELREGDLLVCEGGEVGRCAIWHNEIEGCYFQKAVHRIRCNEQYLVPGYLAYWFKHHSDFNQFEDIVGGKTSIAHLPGVKLKALQIPLPPIEQQQAFCALCDQTDKSKYCGWKSGLRRRNLIKNVIREAFLQ